MLTLPSPSERIRFNVENEQVPILDLLSYLNGESGAIYQAASDLQYIQDNLGFYYITNHGVSSELLS